MKVSILASNLSSNAMGRVLVLARVLSRSHVVEIVGPMFGREVWAPIANEKLDIKALTIDESPRSIRRMRQLSQLPSGDVLYACKPVWSSFGTALGERKRTARPVVLDIDDWEWGFSLHAIRSARNKARYLASAALHAHLPNAWPSAFLFDRLTDQADAVTVSNSRLRDRYGGEIVWHGRDTAAFEPARYPRDEMRERINIDPNQGVVVFFGTIQPYKGLDDLIDAVSGLSRKDVHLMIVGVGESAPARAAVAYATSRLGDRVSVFGIQPFERVPEFIAAADVVVIPQRRSVATELQMPAKLFDAMAMARPVVATAVSDIPRVLDGCGWVVEPDSPQALAVAIREVLDNPTRAEEMGAAARAACVSRYSWDAIERTLNGVFDRLEVRGAK